MVDWLGDQFQRSKHGGKRKGAGRPKGSTWGKSRAHERNPLRTVSQWNHGEFIGIDGEGYNRPDGTHIYSLLQLSTGEYLNRPDGIPLRTIECWLLEARKAHPKAIFVGYNLSYDVTKWFTGKGGLESEADIPVVRGLNKTDFIFPYHEWNFEEARWYSKFENADDNYGFQIRYLRHKEFLLKDHGAFRGLYPDRMWSKHIVVWDVYTSFVERFDKVVEKWLPADPRIAIIREGKERRAEHTRADFEGAAFEKMLRYNHAEVTALADVMHKFWESARRFDLRQRRWDGPGATAEAIFKKYGVARYRWSGIEPPYPAEFLKAVFLASFAGRAECIRYGFHSGPLYYADINSAYPHAERKLPCLRPGHYDLKHLSGSEALGSRAPFILYRVKWNFGEGDLFYPFPWRASETGKLYFPPQGEGWYWNPEVEAAARDSEWAQGMEILEGWSLTPTCDDAPFAFVPGLYDERVRLKGLQDPAENVLRLGLNSLFGKCAQQLGGTREKPPRWWEPLWASMITSYCRAQMLGAMRDNARGLVQVATDGLITTERPPFHEGNELGGWKVKSYVAGVFAPTSGVYILKNADGDEEIRARGYNRESITPLAMIQGWALGTLDFPASGKRFWTLSASFPRSLKSAASLERAKSKVGSWEDETRMIRLRPDPEGKRDDVTLNPHPERGLVETRPTMPLNRRIVGMTAPGGPRWWEGEPDIDHPAEPEIVVD